ncbi:MAG: AraC family ligand binding domain-containing protein [Chloroflexi bacterium]|nr:AraC family ligand binding domain-containing protein [Chloroflexota bacterium]
MRLEKATAELKGWYAASWETPLLAAIGYAHAAVDEPHLHRRITEIYLVARGSAQAVVAGRALALSPGDLLVVEPGEAHTFLASSPDYLHFVIHLPRLDRTEALADKIILSAANAPPATS